MPWMPASVLSDPAKKWLSGSSTPLPTQDQTATGTTSGPQDIIITLSQAPAAGHAVVVTIGKDTSGIVCGVSGLGATWQKVTEAYQGSLGIEQWIGVGVVSGSTVTVHLSGTTGYAIDVADIGGAVPTSGTVVAKSSTGKGSSANPKTPDLTVDTTGDLVLGGYVYSGTASASSTTDTGPAWTLLATVTNSTTLRVDSGWVSGVSGTTHSHQGNFPGSAPWVSSGVVLYQTSSQQPEGYRGWGLPA